MPSRVPKTREQLIDSAIKMYKSAQQYRQKLASGEMSEDDIVEMAAIKADEWIAQREATRASADSKTDADVDQDYRAEREALYRREFQWNEANDENSLQQLLTLEVEMRRTERELGRASATSRDKEFLRGQLKDLVATHTGLQKMLGIDRTTRDVRKAAGDPMAAWRAVVDSGAAKMQALTEEFPQAIRQAATEAEMRPLVKHHLGFPYAIVDALLAQHRQVLGLPTEVERE